jgi:hypothetical protein
MEEQSVIGCDKRFGPVFGGKDLFISDNCNTNNDSCACFPIFYNRKGPNQYFNDQNSYKAFSGATEGSNFRVIEYEVFQAIFD